jgi:hypothetical protein
MLVHVLGRCSHTLTKCDSDGLNLCCLGMQRRGTDGACEGLVSYFLPRLHLVLVGISHDLSDGCK